MKTISTQLVLAQALLFVTTTIMVAVAPAAEATPAPAPEGPPDIAINGGFETAGDKEGWPAQGWKGEIATRSNEQHHSGEWSLKFPINEPNPGKGVAVGQTGDVSRIKPGDTIEFSAYVLTTIPLTKKHSVDIWIQLADSKWANKVMMGAPLISTTAVVNEWKLLSGSFVVPEDFSPNWKLRYAPRLVNSNEAATPGALYFDDFKVVIKPKEVAAAK